MHHVMTYDEMTTSQKIDTLRGIIEERLGHNVQEHLNQKDQVHRNAIVQTSRNNPTQPMFDAQDALDPHGNVIDSRSVYDDKFTRLRSGGGTMETRVYKTDAERQAAKNKLAADQKALQTRIDKSKKKA